MNVLLKDYDYLITKKKIEEEDEWTDFINPKTEFVEEAFADANVRSVKPGEIIQFERKGFYICDKKADGPDGRMEFILIPDGRSATISLKAKPAAVAKKVKPAAANAVLPPPVAQGLPELAPKEAQPYMLDSRGLAIPVKTKVGWTFRRIEVKSALTSINRCTVLSQAQETTCPTRERVSRCIRSPRSRAEVQHAV